MTIHYFILSFLALVLNLTHAQPTHCTYSCPTTDESGQALLKRPLAVPYESDYSVFECVYGTPNPNPTTQSCFYNKLHGGQVLGAQTDGCPDEAPCSETAGSFSSPGHPEVPPWIENGRWLLHVIENHT